MTGAVEEGRARTVVLAEAIGFLALSATRRLYDEQPDLWKLGEHGRARTHEDFTHHVRMLAGLQQEVFAEHVSYCQRLWSSRGFPTKWLDDAWRILDDVLREELPPHVHEPALAILRTVTGSSGASAE